MGGIGQRFSADTPSSPVIPTDDPELFVDSFGQTWRRATPYYYATNEILSDIEQISHIDQRVNWPDVNDPHWTRGVSQRAKMLRENGEFFIVARMVNSHGPFQTACDLRGSEAFLLDMAINPDLAFALLERITDVLAGLTRAYLQACGPCIDMIELPGDDYAGNTNLVFSPAMFRSFIKPALQKIILVIKDTAPNIKIMFHSDGAIHRLIPDLIELGIDVIHPLEPLPANDLVAIKAQYGQQVSFLGGIDISHAMPGSAQQVIDEVRLRIQQLGPGGGYILAPSNHLQSDVPPENVVTLFEAAREFGRYPLNFQT